MLCCLFVRVFSFQTFVFSNKLVCPFFRPTKLYLLACFLCGWSKIREWLFRYHINCIVLYCVYCVCCPEICKSGFHSNVFVQTNLLYVCILFVVISIFAGDYRVRIWSSDSLNLLVPMNGKQLSASNRGQKIEKRFFSREFITALAINIPHKFFVDMFDFLYFVATLVLVRMHGW